MFSFEKDGDQYSNFNLKDLNDLINKGVLSQREADDICIENSKQRVVQLRKAAYLSESDPLYMEWQFDKTPASEKAWRDKVAEIKARYPLPTTE